MSTLVTRDHRIQPERGVGRFCLRDDLNASLRLMSVDLVDEVTVVTAQTNTPAGAIRMLRQRRHTDHPTVTNHR